MSLIKEFAVEPRVMATWTHFNSLWEDFGVGKGRLISKFPVLWINKVDELARLHSKPVQASAISSKLRRDTHKFIVKSRNYSGTMDWLSNARAQMNADPFHAIIATENPNAAEPVLIAGEFAKDEPPFQVLSQASVPRQAADLARCASLLLRHSEEIRLIDPYFDPSVARFRNSFRAFLQMRNASSPRLRVLEIHRKRDAGFSFEDLAQHYSRLAQSIPAGVMLKVYFWQQREDGPDLHPRFLLTDVGGMNFENGLDEGEPGTVTLVTLLEHTVWQKCVRDYCRGSTTFAITPDCILEIAGRR